MPGDSAPGKVPGVGEAPVTVMVKFPAVAEPPKLFTTCLITVSRGWMSLFVTVQVLACPTAIDPVQSVEKLEL